MEKESFFSVDVLIAIAVLLSIALVGYNAFLLPDYAPAELTYTQMAEEYTPPPSAEELRVNINTADLQELQLVPGIGPVTAEKIIEYREQAGVIMDLRELLEVKGIGEATLEKLMPYLTLEG